MRRGHGGRVPYPTEEQIVEAVSLERAIEACSGVRCDALIYLNIAFRNGDISTVWMDDVAAVPLLRALKAPIPNSQTIPAAMVTGGPLGIQVQEGHMVG
jgi:hypothetical protein